MSVNRFGFGWTDVGYAIPGWLGWPLWIITLPLQFILMAILATKDFE